MLAAGGAGALLVAACSSDSSSSTTSAASAGSSATTTGAASTVAATAPSNSQGSTPDGGGTVPDHPKGGTLRYATVSEPTTFDPHKGASGGDHVSLYPIFDRLLNADPETLAPQPSLAKAWEFTDPQTLVLELEEGVMFTDGTPFDAAAVVYNINRALTMDDSSVKTDVSSIDAAEATSQYVVTIHLNQPDSSLLGVFTDRAGMMVSPKAAESADFGEHPVGTGPHTFGAWTHGDNWTYQRNDNYWRAGLPYLDGLEIHLVSDANTRLNGVQSGQFDFIDGIPAASLEDIKAASGVTVNVNPTITEYMIWLNSGRGPLADVRVRKAINIAIDRNALWQGTMYDTGEPAWIPVPSQHWAYDASSVPSFEYDVEAAKQLLADAGYPDGFTLTMTSTNQDDFVQRAEVVQADLAKIGVKVEVTPQPTTDSVDAYFRNKTVDSYNSAMTARADPSITYQTVFAADSFYNAGAYAPDGFADLLKAAKSAQTTDDRRAAFSALNKSIIENALWIPLVYPSGIMAWNSDFDGFVPALIDKPNFLTMYKTS